MFRRREMQKRKTALANARKAAVKQLRQERRKARGVTSVLLARTRRLAVAEAAKGRDARQLWQLKSLSGQLHARC